MPPLWSLWPLGFIPLGALATVGPMVSWPCAPLAILSIGHIWSLGPFLVCAISVHSCFIVFRSTSWPSVFMMICVCLLGETVSCWLFELFSIFFPTCPPALNALAPRSRDYIDGGCSETKKKHDLAIFDGRYVCVHSVPQVTFASQGLASTQVNKGMLGGPGIIEF